MWGWKFLWVNSYEHFICANIPHILHWLNVWPRECFYSVLWLLHWTAFNLGICAAIQNCTRQAAIPVMWLLLHCTGVVQYNLYLSPKWLLLQGAMWLSLHWVESDFCSAVHWCCKVQSDFRVATSSSSGCSSAARPWLISDTAAGDSYAPHFGIWSILS